MTRPVNDPTVERHHQAAAFHHAAAHHHHQAAHHAALGEITEAERHAAAARGYGELALDPTSLPGTHRQERRFRVIDQ